MQLSENFNKTENLSWQGKINFCGAEFFRCGFSTSFSIEDQVILDFIAENKLDIEVFTLDTGRLK